jgi:hypothetical protein
MMLIVNNGIIVGLDLIIVCTDNDVDARGAPAALTLMGASTMMVSGAYITH